MGVVVDSSVLIASERRRFDLPRLFADHARDTFFISVITASELLHGVERARPAARRNARSRFVEAVIDQLEPIDFDLAVARRHAILWASLEKTGKMIGVHDLLIAATALHYGHAVATLNVAELQQVPNLKLLAIEDYRK